MTDHGFSSPVSRDLTNSRFYEVPPFIWRASSISGSSNGLGGRGYRTVQTAEDISSPLFLSKIMTHTRMYMYCDLDS
eukprot:5395436-Pleurochrysis_carterae.AAC.2